jgi:L-threonylcarbamoyladenylate synthase
MKANITTDIGHCQALLRQGELVAIPTETVYGLAANIHDEAALRRIFEVKGRPLFNPLIVHIHHADQVDTLATDIPEKARLLMETFWPGPLTLILPKKAAVSDLITAGKSTVAIRIPRHPITRELLKDLGFPIAAPSANPFTKVSPTSAQHVASYFGDRIPAILDGGPCEVGLESTIVGFEGDAPIIYRKGGVSVEAIVASVGQVRLVLKDEKAPVAPGMLLKHYAPNTPLVISDDITQTLKAHLGAKMGVLSFAENHFPAALVVKVLSPKRDMAQAAQNLYAFLHELDGMGLDGIIVERFPDVGLGRSINDRLERAQH